MNGQQFKVKRISGISLLELMMVIAVGAVIAISLFNFLGTKNYHQSLNQTAKGMLTILQSAVDETRGPGTLPTTDELLNDHVISQRQACSSLPGTDFTTQKICGDKASFQIINTNSDLLIGTAITLNNNNTLQDLYAYLPTAGLNANTKTLTTYSSTINPRLAKQGWLVSGGVWESNDHMYLPKCPSGYEGHYITTPVYQRTDSTLDENTAYNLRIHYAGCDYSDTPNESCTDTIYSPSSNSPYIQTRLFVSEEDDGQNFNYFLTFCLPNGYWENQPYAANTSHNKGYSAQDGQCFAKKDVNNNWAKYNSGATVLPCGEKVSIQW